MSDPSLARWERWRRLVLSIVAAFRDLDPDGRYTLDVKVVQREQAAKRAT